MEEKNIKNEKKVEDKGKENEEKGGLRKAVSKYAPLSLKGAVVTLATSAVLAAGCMSDDKKTSNDTNTAEATEVVDGSDAENDVPEEVLDAGEDTVNDVDDRDGPVRLDSIEEDVRRDTSVDGVEDVSEDSESDASVDTGSDAGEEVVPGTCGPVAAVSTVFMRPGETATVGNVTVEYMGMSGSDGRYQVSCGTLVDMITVPEGSTGIVDLGVGYVAELHANTVRSYASNLTITIRASS